MKVYCRGTGDARTTVGACVSVDILLILSYCGVIGIADDITKTLICFNNQRLNGINTMKKTPESNPIIRLRAAPTRGNAIKAMCAQCMGCTDDNIEPGFRALIRDCTSPQCALYAFRPYRPKQSAT